MPPKHYKSLGTHNENGERVKKWAKKDNNALKNGHHAKRPFAKRRRKNVAGDSLPSVASDLSIDNDEMLGGHRKGHGGSMDGSLTGRDKSMEEAEMLGGSERITTSAKVYKMSRGIVDRHAAPIERTSTIEDAVYIYRTVVNNGSRPPIFLQKNLVYLPKKGKKSSTRKKYTVGDENDLIRREEFESLIDQLASLAAQCSQVQISISEILNVRTNPVEKKDLTIELFLQKNCYKRRKTDTTTKEKLIKTFRLNTPVVLDPQAQSVVIDSSEISADVGCHHMSSCFLKVKITIATDRKSKLAATAANRKSKKKYYVDTVETKHLIKEYVSTLLIFSGGKSFLPNGKQTLFLQEIKPPPKAPRNPPKYMDWSSIDTGPQVVIECLQFANRRSARTCSPVKVPGTPIHSFPPTLANGHGLGRRADTPSSTGSSSVAPRLVAEFNSGLSNGLSNGLGSGLGNGLGNGLTAMNPGLNNPLGGLPQNRLFFVMQYKGSTQTTVQRCFTCPFCLKQTRPPKLELLLKHLRLCHSRLLFLYRETDGEPAIIVSVNTYYDGSYAGNPLDIIPIFRQPVAPGEAYKRIEPRRRSPYTEVHNVRANRKPIMLEEFTKPEPLPLISSGNILLGHNRLYYHSITNQPIMSNDFDADSDGEDTEWSRIASSRLIDEFIDVNKGEKELMKLWNNFISRNTQYISDVQMEEGCIHFVREHSEILSFKLRNNFLCHLATLYDSGVLATRHVRTIVESLPKKSAIVKSKCPQQQQQQHLLRPAAATVSILKL